MGNMLQEVQLELFEIEKSNDKVDLTSTFADNMKLPIHKWYRYTAGFSGPWVRELIYKENVQNVLDPFGGSGTVMLEGEFAGVNTIGIEAHPYVYRYKTSFTLNAEKKQIEFITNHAPSSYELNESGTESSLLNITDPAEFRRNSKYLVITY